MTYMHCPRCTDKALKITKVKEIEIDYCPKCRGIWLDHGELNHIIERSKIKPAKSEKTAVQKSTSLSSKLPKIKTKKSKSLFSGVADFFEDIVETIGEGGDSGDD